MNRDSRLKHIAELEKVRESRVIIYLTMAKQPLGTAIAEDAVALLHKHLRRIAGTADKLKRLDLFLYSRGGDVSVP